MTQKMQKRTAQIMERQEIDEHIILLNDVMADLQKAIKDITEYLTPNQNGAAATRLLPINKIISELKEVAAQLTGGLHFPFRFQTENWRIIQKYVSINAYFDRPCVYNILKFPVVAYSMLEIIKTIPLPRHDYDNVFAFLKITNPRGNQKIDTYLRGG